MVEYSSVVTMAVVATWMHRRPHRRPPIPSRTAQCGLHDPFQDFGGEEPPGSVRGVERGHRFLVGGWGLRVNVSLSFCATTMSPCNMHVAPRGGWMRSNEHPTRAQAFEIVGQQGGEQPGARGSRWGSKTERMSRGDPLEVNQLELCGNATDRDCSRGLIADSIPESNLPFPSTSLSPLSPPCSLLPAHTLENEGEPEWACTEGHVPNRPVCWLAPSEQ